MKSLFRYRTHAAEAVPICSMLQTKSALIHIGVPRGGGRRGKMLAMGAQPLQIEIARMRDLVFDGQ
jgi:hypothetical protein